MNLITCGALLCLHIDWVSNDKRVVYFACFIFALSGLAIATYFKQVVKKEVVQPVLDVAGNDFEKESLLTESA